MPAVQERQRSRARGERPGTRPPDNRPPGREWQRQPSVATLGRRATLDVMMTPNNPDDLHRRGLRINPGDKKRFTIVDTSAGGNEVNAGLNIARQGVETTIYTVAGTDGIGDAIDSELKRAARKNPDLNVRVRRHGESRLSTILFNPGEDRRVLGGSPGDKMEDTGVRFEKLKSNVKKHDYFYFTYMGQGFIDVVNEVKAQNKRYSMSLNSVDLDEIGPHHYEAIAGADILFANLDEAKKITKNAPDLIFDRKKYARLYNKFADKENISKEVFMQLHMFKALGVTWGSISDGSKGAYLIDENDTILHIAPFNTSLPPEERVIVNTLGAGDAFASGIIAARARGQSAEEAVRRGAIMSDKTIREVGPNGAKTSPDDMADVAWNYIGFKPTTVFEKPHLVSDFVYTHGYPAEYPAELIDPVMEDRKIDNSYPFAA